MAIRRSSLSPENSSIASPRTKTGVVPRKCTPTTGAPALTRRTRSDREGRGTPVSLTLGDAAFEPLTNLLLGQIAADEDDAAVTRFIRTPGTLVVAVEDHVHALEDKSLRVVLEREDTLAPKDLRAFFGNEILDPGKKLVGVQRPVDLERDRLH